MTTREQDLQRRLDEATRRLDALERRRPSEASVSVRLENPPRNALQSVSDWWHGGSSAGARSRHMRVNY
jgi:hypothetical protein